MLSGVVAVLLPFATTRSRARAAEQLVQQEVEFHGTLRPMEDLRADDDTTERQGQLVDRALQAERSSSRRLDGTTFFKGRSQELSRCCRCQSCDGCFSSSHPGTAASRGLPRRLQMAEVVMPHVLMTPRAVTINEREVRPGRPLGSVNKMRLSSRLITEPPIRGTLSNGQVFVQKVSGCGNGLFAGRNFERGDIITQFEGDIVHLCDMQKRTAPDRCWAIRVHGTDVVIDGLEMAKDFTHTNYFTKAVEPRREQYRETGLAHLSNSCAENLTSCNAKVIWRTPRRKKNGIAGSRIKGIFKQEAATLLMKEIFLQATTDIRRGIEIRWKYQFSWAPQIHAALGNGSISRTRQSQRIATKRSKPISNVQEVRGRQKQDRLMKKVKGTVERDHSEMEPQTPCRRSSQKGFSAQDWDDTDGEISEQPSTESALATGLGSPISRRTPRSTSLVYPMLGTVKDIPEKGSTERRPMTPARWSAEHDRVAAPFESPVKHSATGVSEGEIERVPVRNEQEQNDVADTERSEEQNDVADTERFEAPFERIYPVRIPMSPRRMSPRNRVATEGWDSPAWEEAEHEANWQHVPTARHLQGLQDETRDCYDICDEFLVQVAGDAVSIRDAALMSLVAVGSGTAFALMRSIIARRGRDSCSFTVATWAPHEPILGEPNDREAGR